jgi:hypothetical protein
MGQWQKILRTEHLQVKSHAHGTIDDISTTASPKRARAAQKMIVISRWCTTQKLCHRLT